MELRFGNFLITPSVCNSAYMILSKAASIPTRLSDYRAPDFLLPKVSLSFEIQETETVVRSELHFRRAASASSSAALCLDGQNLKLAGVYLDGIELSPSQYQLSDEQLVIDQVPNNFVLSITTHIEPHKNESGLGLYFSGSLLCTQMEAQGFRKVTYFPDRPDVLSIYTVRIDADKKLYPVLLSNGNLVESGSAGSGRHFAVFYDHHPKPCYLFALVAGQLAKVSKQYVSSEGRKVTLDVFSELGNEKRCLHALDSLERALIWDEKVFGLAYDLDTYVVVAANDFNAGAMENKGLNIFNAALVLADPESATDADYYDVEKTIAHEAFHNYTGNRVTLRDWFQLTLKEGLTVYRDQEFSADQTSAAVERLASIRYIRERQFLEDAGPNAHPIRPESYLEIDNFYTPTVYRKGSEVLRMLATLTGRQQFIEGVREYLRRFDGQAVTVEDFLAVLAQSTGRDLTLFKNWYQQFGTPQLKVSGVYEQARCEYILEVEQSQPRMGEAATLLHIPLVVGLLDQNGTDMPIDLVSGETSSAGMLEITKKKHRFVFRGLESKPVPSLLRNFSAPVRLDFNYSDQELAFLLAHDSDAVSRFEAGQALALRVLRSLTCAQQSGEVLTVPPVLLQAFKQLLLDDEADPFFKAEALKLPSLSVLCADLVEPDFSAALAARRFLQQSIATYFGDALLDSYSNCCSNLNPQYRYEQRDVGLRTLKNRLLIYVAHLDSAEAIRLPHEQFCAAKNMTESEGALLALILSNSRERIDAEQNFYARWKSDSLVLNILLSALATAPYSDVLARIRALEIDPAVNLKNANHIRSIVGGFGQNLAQFHALSGQGYAYIAEKVQQIDSFNPNVAASLAKLFHAFEKLDAKRKSLMGAELEGLLKQPTLSKGVREIISKTVAA
jgi:aminopeptidase N